MEVKALMTNAELGASACSSFAVEVLLHMNSGSTLVRHSAVYAAVLRTKNATCVEVSDADDDPAGSFSFLRSSLNLDRPADQSTTLLEAVFGPVVSRRAGLPCSAP